MTKGNTHSFKKYEKELKRKKKAKEKLARRQEKKDQRAESDMNQAADPVDIIVATPGKLLDFQRHQDMSLKKIEVLIIDDADQILDMAFILGGRKIIYSTPTKEKPYAVNKTTPKQIIK